MDFNLGQAAISQVFPLRTPLCTIKIKYLSVEEYIFEETINLYNKIYSLNEREKQKSIEIYFIRASHSVHNFSSSYIVSPKSFMFLFVLTKTG